MWLNNPIKSTGHIANSSLLVTGGRKEPMVKIFAGNQLETSIAVHTNQLKLPEKPVHKLIKKFEADNVKFLYKFINRF